MDSERETDEGWCLLREKKTKIFLEQWEWREMKKKKMFGAAGRG